MASEHNMSSHHMSENYEPTNMFNNNMSDPGKLDNSASDLDTFDSDASDYDMTEQGPTSDHLPTLQKAIELLEKNRIPTKKWQKRPAVPLLVFYAVDRDDAAVSEGTKHIVDIAQQTKRKKEIIQERKAEGKHWSCLAKQLGHREIDGMFPWKRRGAQPAGCYLCGLEDHDLKDCRHLTTYYEEFGPGRSRQKKGSKRSAANTLSRALQPQSSPDANPEAATYDAPDVTNNNNVEGPHPALHGLATHLLPNSVAVAGDFRGYIRYDPVTRQIVDIQGFFHEGVMRDTDGVETQIQMLQVPISAPVEGVVVEGEHTGAESV